MVSLLETQRNTNIAQLQSFTYINVRRKRDGGARERRRSLIHYQQK